MKQSGPYKTDSLLPQEDIPGVSLNTKVYYREDYSPLGCDTKQAGAGLSSE
jgi:hypothetical protein